MSSPTPPDRIGGILGDENLVAPDRFDSITAARSWMRSFVHWYNHVHYHSGIGYLRPVGLHDANHTAIIEHRQAVLDAAAAAQPHRFTRRPTPARIPTKAWINNHPSNPRKDPAITS